MERVERSGLAYYRNPDWGLVTHGIFTRRGGVSEGQWRSLNVGGSIGDDPEAVRENHRRIYQTLDVAGTRAVTTWLVHGTDTLVVDDTCGDAEGLVQADGIITNRPDTPLVMRYADCAPLLLYDPVKRSIGLGHAGWRGTLNGMAVSMVKAMMRAYESRPQDIEVVIGPAISRRNYQVGSEVVAAAYDYFGEGSGIICRDSCDGGATLDLWLANQLDFQRMGVEQVKVLRMCTYDHNDDFFSHRAEGGNTGRFAVVMCL